MTPINEFIKRKKLKTVPASKKISERAAGIERAERGARDAHRRQIKMFMHGNAWWFSGREAIRTSAFIPTIWESEENTCLSSRRRRRQREHKARTRSARSRSTDRKDRWMARTSKSIPVHFYTSSYLFISLHLLF